MNVLWAVLWKDLLSEWRSRDRVVAMLLFSLLVVVVFHFSLPGGLTPETRASAPGVMWVAWVFAAVLGLGRSWAVELENDALSGLAVVPADRGWVFLGKAAGNLVVLGVVQLVTAGAFALVFELDLWRAAGPLAAISLLGAVGLCSLGTTFGAVSVRTRLRELMLPLLALPFFVPVLAPAASATAAVLEGGALPVAAVQLLLVTDAIYLIASFVLFDFVLDE